MPVPTWLPPLFTNDGHVIRVIAEECPPPPYSPSSGFMINSNVTITYMCTDLRVSRAQLKGLSLSQSFCLPLESVDILTPSKLTSSKEAITSMLGLMPVPFPLDGFGWRATRLYGPVPSIMFLGETDVVSWILKYLVLLRGSNGQDQLFAANLTIHKTAFVPKENFVEWLRWYDMNRAMNLSFEADYAEAISRPWSYDAAFYETLNVRCVCPSLVNLVQGVEFDVARDSEDVCPLCLERFVAGSRVTRLPCNHMYHGICIVEWVMRSDLCPLCRSDFSRTLYLGF